MKDQAFEIIRGEATDLSRRHRLREYLQHVLLRQLFEMELLGNWIFHGGTALRILHELARFSEDLDFHLSEPNEDYDLGARTHKLAVLLERQGYAVELKLRTKPLVQSCTVQFVELLYECGLSSHRGQKLNITVQIDTNPPVGFAVGQRGVDLFFPFVVSHHDRPSFVAGKLHAILQRGFTKGRDFYDLMFFLNRWPDTSPNLTYLKNSLLQTAYAGEILTEVNWRSVVARRIESLDWKQVVRDVEPFLLRPGDAEAFRREFLIRLLETPAQT